jgi:hypothetical protein
MEIEILDVRHPLPKMLNEDGMWEDDLNKHDKPSCEKPGQMMLAWRGTMWAYTKIAKLVSRFHWDAKSMWWIDKILAEKVHQWEEEDHLTCEEEELRKMGQRCIDLDGDQLMDVKDEVADTLSGSRSEVDEHNS